MSVNLSAKDMTNLMWLGGEFRKTVDDEDEALSQLKAEIIVLCEWRDVSSYRIAQLTGLSQTTVNRWRREAGV